MGACGTNFSHGTNIDRLAPAFALEVASRSMEARPLKGFTQSILIAPRYRLAPEDR